MPILTTLGVMATPILLIDTIRYSYIRYLNIVYLQKLRQVPDWKGKPPTGRARPRQVGQTPAGRASPRLEGQAPDWKVTIVYF